MEIRYAWSSFRGDRDLNEDFVLMGRNEDRYCFAVADGLGGHGSGEVASRLVCETVMDCLAHREEMSLEEMFEEAQRALMERQHEERASDAMKTTLNLLVADAKEIKWGHVGDTRTYYFRRKRMVGRTKDHSVPQMMATMGEIKEKDIRHHVDRNRLLRVMGIEWAAPQYVMEKELKVRCGQAFCMCTDGFWEWIEDKEMEKCLRNADSVQEWLDAMNDVVRGRGTGQEMDNYSALAIWVV